jgi:hypothetical protein
MAPIIDKWKTVYVERIPDPEAAHYLATWILRIRGNRIAFEVVNDNGLDTVASEVICNQLVGSNAQSIR